MNWSRLLILVELTVKSLNACGSVPNYWVFASGLTNVQVILKVTDTMTGAFKTYTNPQGVAFQPIQDTAAFVASKMRSPWRAPSVSPIRVIDKGFLRFLN